MRNWSVRAGWFVGVYDGGLACGVPEWVIDNTQKGMKTGKKDERMNGVWESSDHGPMMSTDLA
jgi:hypothetical protein